MKYFNQNVNFPFFPSFIKKEREDVEVVCEHGSGHLCKALCAVPSADSPPPPPTRRINIKIGITQRATEPSQAAASDLYNSECV